MTEFFGFDPENDEVIDRAVLPHRKPATDRSSARRLALQALYELDSTNHQPGDVINFHITSDQDRKVRSYFTRLVTQIHQNRQNLDAVLQDYATEFPIDQIAVIDRNILRIALFEMAVEDIIPLGVVIDEAVELAKLFGAESSMRFINGVLGTVSENLDSIIESLNSVLPPSNNT